VRTLKVPGLLALVILEVGCGLPSPYFLSPPVVPQLAQVTSPNFYFASTSANNEVELRGFEVYYKFETDPASQGFINDTNLGSTTNTYTDLTVAGFSPLCSSTDVSPLTHQSPLVPIAIGDRGQAFTVTLTISTNTANSGISTYSYTGPVSGSVIGEVRRAAPLPSNLFTSGCKLFLSNSNVTSYTDYDPTADNDVRAIFSTAQSSGGTAYLMMYALTYGLQDISTPIYSNPVYLGYISINILTS